MKFHPSYLKATCLAALLGCTFSCIQPILHLPAEEVIVDLPIVIADMEIVWNLDVDWQTQWHYGWDIEDEERWGKIEYPIPSSFEVRRYYLGEEAGGPHTNVDAFGINEKRFRRSYEFGYYDLLIWSNIDSQDGTQVLTIDESSLDEVTASTTVTRAIKLGSHENDAPTALFNQPEIFYSDYPRDIHISHNKEDYDYYDEEENVWVKHINSELRPLVYIYLVQIILHNNDGRVVGINGDCALSAMASGTSVNTGKTNNTPCIVYFNTNLKKGLYVENEKVDVIGGKLTTFGLCDMENYIEEPKSQYQGSRQDLPNFLYFDLKMSEGSVMNLRSEVTEQCQAQCHGGVITVHVDCQNLKNIDPDEAVGGLFVPSVDDYEELIYDIPLG